MRFKKTNKSDIYNYEAQSDKFINLYELKCHMALLVTEEDFESIYQTGVQGFSFFGKFIDGILSFSLISYVNKIMLYTTGEISMLTGKIKIEYEKEAQIELTHLKNLKDIALINMINSTVDKKEITNYNNKAAIIITDSKILQYIIGKNNYLIENCLRSLGNIKKMSPCMKNCPGRFKYELIGTCELVFCEDELYRMVYLPKHKNYVYLSSVGRLL